MRFGDPVLAVLKRIGEPNTTGDHETTYVARCSRVMNLLGIDYRLCRNRCEKRETAALSRRFGQIEGISLGDQFSHCQYLSQTGIHRPPIAEISGSDHEGYDSIVLNGGYESDEDYSDEIVYTGQGGRSPSDSRPDLNSRKSCVASKH